MRRYRRRRRIRPDRRTLSLFGRLLLPRRGFPPHPIESVPQRLRCLLSNYHAAPASAGVFFWHEIFCPFAKTRKIPLCARPGDVHFLDAQHMYIMRTFIKIIRPGKITVQILDIGNAKTRILQFALANLFREREAPRAANFWPFHLLKPGLRYRGRFFWHENCPRNSGATEPFRARRLRVSFLLRLRELRNSFCQAPFPSA